MPPARLPRRLAWPAAGLMVAVAGAVALAPLWRANPKAARLTVLVSGDTAGWIVPCGCTSNQSGGLPRRATHVQNLRANGQVLLADAGGAPGGVSAYARLKFEAVLRGELAMGLDVHNLGGPEAALGAGYLRDVRARLGAPFVSANLRDERGEAVAEPLRVVERAGRRVAVAGVLSPRYARAGLRVDDPREAVLRAAAEARGRYDALIVLAYLPEEELRAFAALLPEAEAVVGGPTGQAIAPTRAGPTLMAAATNKGKFLIELEPGAGLNPWSGRVVEMDASLPDDAAQAANVRQYLGELGRRDFTARETGLAPALPADLPATYRLAGDQVCKSCHTADASSWAGTAHAHAWQTLEGKGYQVDPFCQQCHATGFGLPGGFESVAGDSGTRSVRCEACHGPSLAHSRRPQTRTPFAARDQCRRCHDHENSPTFAYDPFWEKIRHGAPADPSGRSPKAPGGGGGGR